MYHISRNSTDSIGVEINEGDVISKWGTVAKPGWTEEEIRSYTRIVSIGNGEVILNASLSVVSWWGEMTLDHIMHKETKEGKWQQFT